MNSKKNSQGSVINDQCMYDHYYVFLFHIQFIILYNSFVINYDGVLFWIKKIKRIVFITINLVSEKLLKDEIDKLDNKENLTKDE